MKGRTKKRLLAAIIVALVVVAAVWYAQTRPTYKVLTTLREVAFLPAAPPSVCPADCPAGEACVAGECVTPLPTLTFTFSEPIDPTAIAGTTAILKSFVPDPGTPPDAAAALLASIRSGGVPFSPVLVPPSTITTNAMPAALNGSAAFLIWGSGEVWLATPPPHA